MTVISTIISRHCIAIATDSLLTEKHPYKATEWERSKIVPIPKLRAAACYWGLAYHGNWSTYDWLRIQALRAGECASLEEFANAIRDELEQVLNGFRFRNPLNGGVGIHIAGYEDVNGCWIPELFVCSNYRNETYKQLCCLHVTRETYLLALELKNRPEPWTTEQGRDPETRRQVYDYLRTGRLMIFNNGDPEIYNRVASGVLGSAQVLAARGWLRDPDDVRIYRVLAQQPIKAISDMERAFCREDKRIVGGRPHDLVILSSGEYVSTSGDAP